MLNAKFFNRLNVNAFKRISVTKKYFKNFLNQETLQDG